MSLHPVRQGSALHPGSTSDGPQGVAGRLWRWLGALPSQCAICHAWPAQPLCAACVERFTRAPRRCPRCALHLPLGTDLCGECLRHPSGLDLCLAACDYAWPWTDGIAKLKFEGQPGWARPLADLMRQTPGAEAALDAADLVLPMPLHERRLRRRGFNQSLELARRLAPAKCDPNVLLRLRDTPAQHGLKRPQRLRNLRGAFGIDSRQADRLKGARVVVIDDVMTTGASLACVAQVLRRAGAAHVTALVVARTAAPD